MTYQEQVNWFKTSISFQIVIYLLCRVNPYLSASIRIPELGSNTIIDTVGLLTGTIITDVSIGWFSPIIGIIGVMNAVMVGMIITQLVGGEILPG